MSYLDGDIELYAQKLNFKFNDHDFNDEVLVAYQVVAQF